MKSTKAIVIAVVLKGSNYLLWSRLMKTALGGAGLWSYITSDAPRPNQDAGSQTDEEEDGVSLTPEERWEQKNLKALSVLQSSMETSILEAYSYCTSAKELWDTLNKVYGNISNLSRVFEIKKAINDLSQDQAEFTTHLGKFRSLWSELESLRPHTLDQDVLNERREQDKVFGLLLTLSPMYNDLIKHILRSDKLPTLEEVCAQVQKEEGSDGLFGSKEVPLLASQAEAASRTNKATGRFNKKDRRGGKCEHCKRDGHTKERCWVLDPSLKPSKFR